MKRKAVDGINRSNKTDIYLQARLKNSIGDRKAAGVTPNAGMNGIVVEQSERLSIVIRKAPL